jgi:hypothetical protein
MTVAAKAAVTCDIKDEQLSAVQRAAMLKKCLIEASSKGNVKQVAEQQKKLSCEQNAWNKGLQGSDKESYIVHCL